MRFTASVRPTTRVHKSLALLVLCLLVLPLAPALAEEHGGEVVVGDWWVAGPGGMAMPAWAGETGVNAREELELKALLPDWPYEAGEAWPEAGSGMAWPGAGELTWGERSGETLTLGGGDTPRLGWVATFVETDRFTEAKLTVSSTQLVRVFFDGEQVAEKTSADADPEEDGEDGEEGDDGEEGADGDEGDQEADDEEPEAGTATATLKVTPGKHLLLLATLLDPESSRSWTLGASLEVKTEDGDEDGDGDEGGEESADAPAMAELTVSNSPMRGVTIPDLLDPPQVQGIDVSADGELVAVTLQQPAVPSDDRTSWVEIVRAGDGSPVRTLRLPVSISGFSWGPTGHTYAYRTSDKGKGTLWIGDLESGRLEPLMEGVEGLGGMRWAPDGESIFVTISTQAEKDDRGVQRVRSLADRWAGYRDLGQVHQVSTADGRSRLLTAGALSTSLEDVSPDGERLLLSRTRFVAETPFVMGELYELGLDTLEVTEARDIVWLGSASYAPDGERVLVLAGPSAFGDTGLAIGAAAAPNEYDGQAYLLTMGETPADDQVTAITRDFDPAVNGATWSHHDGGLYLSTTDTTYGRVYRWQPGSGEGGGSFRQLDTGPDVVSGLSVARSAGTLAYTGSSLQEPEAAWVMDGPQGSGRTLLAPSTNPFEQVRFGRVEDFDFTTEDGVTIPGRLYYPLDFDETKTYPLLTYYYGGVVPTTRSFAGRYPKNFWAANGYAVYVLQPSGAVGFGQERSAVHPNDWGKRVVEEIVAGVDAVVEAHPFIDGSRVGCFGGSYGGFLTMSLVTDSDRFAAAISHAGISGIASYWGEGWWGFLYMATAAHGSYPWNRPDVYVEQSPLFKADQVDTPLLLLHGTADPNVPPGESDQMFAALRVLGKEVEYVRIEGEAHWILTYPKRVLWWQTGLAWFDMHLKDQPEWWQELWGENLDRTGP